MEDKINTEEIMEIIRAHPADQQQALAIMQDIQHRYRYIPREGLLQLSRYLNLPYAHLYAMATFYRALSLEAKGRHMLRVCDGTACHVKGGTHLQQAITALLGIEPGQTTADGLFTLETVSCPGCCALAPLLIADGEYYAKVDDQRLAEIIAGLKGGEV